MNFWIAAVCAVALTVSLIQIARRKVSRGRRAGAALLQIAIWGLVWLLAAPPALLPAENPAPQIELPQRRDALRDLPPLRLPQETGTGTPTWQMRWSQKLFLGEPLQLRIAQTGQKAGRVVLEDPFGNEVDSADLDPEGGSIALSHTPKIPGRWLYQLRFETEGNTPRREPLPLEALPPNQPAVLLWLARPGFETAALSRWLRQSGTPTKVITQLAPEVLLRQSFNGLEAHPRELLDPAGPFDLLILDSHLWPQLSRAQRQQLQALAERKSLLWLVKPDSPSGFLDYARTQGMPLIPTELPEIESSHLVAAETPPLRSSGYQPQREGAGDILLGAPPVYWARSNPSQSLGFVLFTGSYRWITAGFGAEYSRLWKTLFDHQLAYRGGRTPITLQTQLPLAQERVTLCSPAFANTLPRLTPTEGDTSEAPLTGAPLPGGSHACYSWWPQQHGWHKVDLDNGSFYFYVFSHNAWPQWQQSIARAETRQMATARLGPTTDKEIAHSRLPRHWLVLVLILLLAFSWWQERGLLR